MSAELKSIHIWTPGLRDGSGGIQAFSRFFIRAVHENFPSARLRVIVKNDAPGPDDPLRALPATFHSTQAIPGVLRSHAYAALGITLGLKDAPDLALTTHVHYLPPLSVVRHLRGTRCAAVLHGIDAWNLSGLSRTRALRASDHLISVSRFTRDQVALRFGVDPARIDVVPNTFDEGRFTPGPKPPHLLARFGLKPYQPVMLTVSRLARTEVYKGHRQVLYALNHIRRELPDVRYIIAGEGSDLARLREAADVLGLNEHVIFAGRASDAHLADFYRLCDVFVMPSAKEGFGIVFLEAMSSGRPVIAGNRDGSVDALDDGRLGVLVDPCSPAAIARAVTDVLRHRHPNKLLYEPVNLQKAVCQTFGYERFRSSLGASLSRIGRHKKTASSIETPAAAARPVPETPRIVVVTELTSPYQVEFFNCIAATCELRLEVIYLTGSYPGRHWMRPRFSHAYTILDEDRLENESLRALLEADLVVFNNYVSAFSQRALKARMNSGMPWVFWGERPGFHRLGALGRWFRQAALRPLHQSKAPIWGIGRHGIEGYRAEFGEDRTYHDVPYFSDLSRFGRNRSFDGKRKIFLFSGSLSERKGADIAASAFARSAAGRPDMHLVVMGTGPLESSMRETLSSVAGQVTWLGFRDWHEVPEYFNSADFLCAPSRHDGWGLTVVEGLAAGLPVISTRRTGAAIEFLDDGKNGWLCAPDDEDDVVRAMLSAAGLDENSYGRMSAAARATVAEHSLEHGARLFHATSMQALQTWGKQRP